MKGQDKKKYILRLIKNINKSKRRMRKGVYPLEYEDQGWRIVLPKSLELYDFLPSGRKLWGMSVYDWDPRGFGYYWIPLGPAPEGVITPALRLMMLEAAREVEKE
jgi:hypothetical protein